MVKIEELLEPGETVIKEEAMLTYQWKEGRLYLTDRHLIFVTASLLFSRQKILARIPLRNIREVKKGGWPLHTLKVLADKEYKFGSPYTSYGPDKGWVAAIEQARMHVGEKYG